VLRDTNFTLKVLDPVLRDTQPVAPRLARLLRAVVPVANNAIPAVAGITALVPGAERALTSFPPVARRAVPALASLRKALIPLIPVLAGFRPYAPDLVAGFFNGVGGAAGSSYDANGHVLQSVIDVGASGSSLTGLLSLLSGLLGHITAPVPALNGARSRLIAPCPGGGAPPAADSSNPWSAPDVLPNTGKLCNPTDDQR
jgi:hypothetical protein